MLKSIYRFNKSTKATFVAAPFFLFSFLANAYSGPRSLEDFLKILDKIQFFVAEAFWILAVIMTLYAGYLFLTSAENPEKIKKAKTQLLYAVIAIVIGLMAYGLPALLENILTP